MTTAYKKHVFMPTGGFIVSNKKNTAIVKNAMVRELEQQINADLLILFMSRTICKHLKDVIGEVFTNKEAKYFDYAKHCMRLFEGLDYALDMHYHNLLSIGGLEKTDKTGEILLAMFHEVCPIYKDYQYRNHKLFKNEYKLSEDKAQALTTAVMISRLMHVAFQLTDSIYTRFYDKYPNIDLVLVKGHIADSMIFSSEIVKILVKHFTRSDDDIIFPEPMQRYHATFIGALLDKDLFLSSIRNSNIKI